MGTKVWPGEFDCYEKAEPNEPLFTLLARDPVAPLLVDLWAELRLALSTNQDDMAHIAEARNVARAMRRWLAVHRPRKRIVLKRR